MNKQKIFIILIASAVVLVLFLGIFSSKKISQDNEEMDKFAKCITDSGAKLYTAFWCSHCQDQKKSFGQSVKYIENIECSTPDGRGQLDICKDADIEGYPTWVFGDNSRISGKLSFDVLSSKTSCGLPTIE